MTLRSPRERAIQVLWFEAIGLLLATPVLALASGGPAHRSAGLLLLLAALVMAWSPIHNTAFDWVDHRLTGRLASDRPHRWRAVHAVSHEASAVLVTLPAVLWLTGLSVPGALAVEAGLTAFYTAYAYLFHLAFDWLRPVRGGRS